MMDVMEELDGVLTFEALVMAPEELDPYVLSFYPGAMEDGFVECYALCVMRREGGVPTGVLSEEFLDAANSEEGNGVFGPSCTIEVSSVILDNGVSSPTGEKVAVVLIDCTKDVVDHLHLPGIVDELDYGFAEDQPFALPSPDELVLKATGWISVASHQRVGYYSAESAEETPAPALEAGTKKKAEPKKTKPGAGLPIGTAKSVPKPKRATTASLAGFSGFPDGGNPDFDNSSPSSTRSTGKVRRKAGRGPIDYQVPANATVELFAADSTQDFFRSGGKEHDTSSKDFGFTHFGYPGSLDGKASYAKGVGEREAGGFDWRSRQPCTSSSSTESGFDNSGFSDSFSRKRPYGRPVWSRNFVRQQRSPGKSSSSGRAGTPEGHFLHLSVALDGSQNGTYILGGDHPSGDACSRDLGDPLCGAVRGVWKDEGMGSVR